MNRPPIEVADIIRAVGKSFIDKNQSWLNGLHLKVLFAIERCRTAALGGHRDRCLRCGYTAAISYNSCRNRHCPKCQTNARDKWLAARNTELLPVPYVHVVSRCLINWLPWCSTTRRFCTVCCFAPVPQVCSRSLPTRNILAQTSAFSACSTPGDRIFFTIRTFTA